MKTIKTVSRKVIQEEDIPMKPKYKVGDYMEIYFGDYEGHNFYIKDIRYNYDRNMYEYLYNSFIMGDWLGENQIIPA